MSCCGNWCIYYWNYDIYIDLCISCFAEENVRNWKALREGFYFPVFFSVPLFLLGLSMTLRIKRVKEIIENGKKTDGEVVSYRRIHMNYGKRSRLPKDKPNYTILNVRFHDNGNQECAVGVGHKLPEKVLASPYCTVYILNDNVFITDFCLRKKENYDVNNTEYHTILQSDKNSRTFIEK